jgi:hypothetical protein
VSDIKQAFPSVAAPRHNAKLALDSPVDDVSIRYAYFYLLDREPESEAAVLDQAAGYRGSGCSIQDVRQGFKESGEHIGKFQTQCVGRHWRSELHRMGEFRYDDQNPTFEEITLLQTADKDRYVDMLATTSIYTLKFARKNGVDCQFYLGTKRGKHPHHATFNRIFMLKDLIDTGYRGWALYLDADCIISDPAWDIRKDLRALRQNRKIMLLHSTLSPEDPHYRWWHVNAAVFAIDLGANLARLFVEGWASFYDLYATSDYEKAKAWADLPHDQASLVGLLQEMQKYTDLRSHLELTYLENVKVHAAARSDDKETSSDQALEKRRQYLEDLGKQIWR